MCLYILYNPFAISSGSRQYLSFPSTSEALASRRYDSCHMRQRSVDLGDINRKIRSKHHETGVEILGAQLIVQNSPDLRWALLNWKSLPVPGPTLHTPRKHDASMLIFMKHVTSFHIQFIDRMKLWSHEIRASQRIPNDFPFLSAPFGGNHDESMVMESSHSDMMALHFWGNDGQWSVVIFHKPSNTRKGAVGEMSLCETICHRYVKLKRKGRSEERKKTNMSHPSTWRLLWWRKAALWWRRLQVSICFNQSSRTIFRRLKRLKRAHLKWEENKHKHMHSHDQNDTKITSTMYYSNSFICEHWNFETARNNLRCHHINHCCVEKPHGCTNRDGRHDFARLSANCSLEVAIGNKVTTANSWNTANHLRCNYPKNCGIDYKMHRLAQDSNQQHQFSKIKILILNSWVIWHICDLKPVFAWLCLLSSPVIFQTNTVYSACRP